MTYDIYREIILDHYKNPRNFGELENPDIKAKDSNPLCGDVIEIQMKVDAKGIVKDVRFNGQGCAISRASASMLTELVQGKTLDEVRAIGKKDVLDNLGNPDLGPARIKCALLALKVLKVGVYSYIGQAMEKDADLS
ncbi:MAG: SUF system NifU family Fe-S cluster assembly protein [Thaumarchaeota archaeon]|nr:SUF system NifU family Fe-S cluster assembly protein [Nitrososphaerota archaeon]